jgi:phospholipid/cholesterol/gamma-HCH transport system substrate-binding protein
MPREGREVKVGFLLLGALAVLAVSIFVLGEKSNLFKRKVRYHIELASASGLKHGNPVQLDGVDVGVVKKVVLPSDPRTASIKVWIEIDQEYADRIRGPQKGVSLGRLEPESKARIKTLGLLGAKFIEISSGSPRYRPIPAEGEIPSAAPTNVDALLASGEDVMDNVVAISHSLNTILGRMERGEGLLGELTSASEGGGRLRDSLLGASETLERIASKIETGDGALPRLLNDKAMGDRLGTSLERFESLLAKAEGGEGVLPALLNDPQVKVQLNDSLAALNQAAHDVRRLSADYEQGRGLVPKLVKDDEYGKRVSEQLQQLIERLNEVSLRLSQGEGTAAKLINDPQIYEAVNDILIGVNESRFLRWLIRNRQKKGIDRRYNDTRKSLGPAAPPLAEPPADPSPAPIPTAPPVPPPL